MDHFRYIEGSLHVEQVRVRDLVAEVGTPCYVYSATTLLEHYDRLEAAFAALDPIICYAIKSCPNLSICRLLAERGAGMDLVSGGELHRALAAGADPVRCVYAGVGKTVAEIREAITTGVGWLNIESESEFETVSAVAKDLGRTCRAALRINPDVDPRTHRHTTTGVKETKFGVDLERARAFFRTYGCNEHCRLTGLHLHLGSPIFTVEPFVRAIHKALALIDELAAEGYVVDTLDIGGGFGADYESDQSPVAATYAEAIVPLLEPRVRAGLRIILEPGRTITANAGVLVLEVVNVKTSGDKTFVIGDAGMNALLRPSHYDAFHFIWPCEVPPEWVPSRREVAPDLPGLISSDVVGPVCETGDFLARDRLIPPVGKGDLLAVYSAGAYGMSMASQYNSLPRPPEVLVQGEAVTLIRRRETYDDLLAPEREPGPVSVVSSLRAIPTPT